MTPHRQPCPSTQIPTSKTIKSMVVVSPLYPLCWHLPSPGASAGFTLACPPPPLSTVALNPSTETRGRSRISRTHRPFRIMAVSPLSSRCWHLPSTGGLAYFLLDSHPPPPSTVVPAPYPETRGRSIIRRTPRPCCLLIFTLAWRRQ